MATIGWLKNWRMWLLGDCASSLFQCFAQGLKVHLACGLLTLCGVMLYRFLLWLYSAASVIQGWGDQILRRYTGSILCMPCILKETSSLLLDFMLEKLPTIKPHSTVLQKGHLQDTPWVYLHFMFTVVPLPVFKVQMPLPSLMWRFDLFSCSLKWVW